MGNPLPRLAVSCFRFSWVATVKVASQFLVKQNLSLAPLHWWGCSQRWNAEHLTAPGRTL